MGFTPRVDIELDGAGAYIMTTLKKINAGYIFTWKFDSGGELDADQSVPNYDNLDDFMNVVAVLDKRQYWKGGRTDPAQICGRLSAKNKAKLKTITNSGKGGTEQTISLKIVCYDDTGKAYYEYFGFEDAKVVFTPEVDPIFEPNPNTDVPQPQNYSFTISVTAKGDAPKHDFRCAEEAMEKVVVPWGGVGITA